MPDNLLFIIGFIEDEAISVAICLRDESALYGRYWGTSGDYHSLHFETCYYQGIEYCIEQGLSRFEPGTQGEHKIARGFVPTTTYSGHWLADSRFAAAVDEYLADERRHISRYMDAVNEHVPYRREP
jgi:predicted N-acyltransferase